MKQLIAIAVLVIIIVIILYKPHIKKSPIPLSPAKNVGTPSLSLNPPLQNVKMLPLDLQPRGPLSLEPPSPYSLAPSGPVRLLPVNPINAPEPSKEAPLDLEITPQIPPSYLNLPPHMQLKSPAIKMEYGYAVIYDMHMPDIGDISSISGTDVNVAKSHCATLQNCAMFVIDPYGKRTLFKKYPTPTHTGSIPLVHSEGKITYLKQPVYEKYGLATLPVFSPYLRLPNTDMPHIGDIFNAPGVDVAVGKSNCSDVSNCSMFTLDPKNNKTWYKTYPTNEYSGAIPLTHSPGRDMYVKHGLYHKYGHVYMA